MYGQPGVGKSRYVKSFKPFLKSLNKWWDGYEQEETVLIDDLELDSLQYLGHYLKIWADPYGYVYGEVKGAKTALNYKYLYVTSNYDIDECVIALRKSESCPLNRVLATALQRRFRVIECLQGGTWKEKTSGLSTREFE